MASRIKDVAKLAGVSSATVSRVLSNKPHVRSEVKAKVRAAVKELSYEPNRIARSLRVQRSSIIGLVISDIQNSFFNTIVRAIEDAAYEHGFAVFLCNTDENPEKERFYLNLLRAERVAGVILTPTLESSQSCSPLIEAKIPVVSLDRIINHKAIDSVLTDNREASTKLVHYLIQKGHRRIAGIFPHQSITTGRERFEGFKEAFKEANLTLDESLILSSKPVTEEGYQLTRALLDLQNPPKALFVGTKMMTLGALRAIFEKGLRIPEDIDLAAFDKLDWMPFVPAIAYCEQPSYQLGQAAAQLLLERIEKPDKKLEHLVLNSQLVFPKVQEVVSA